MRNGIAMAYLSNGGSLLFWLFNASVAGVKYEAKI